MARLTFCVVFIINVYLSYASNMAATSTQTVYGFLDFTTTIDNTVMIFLPKSAPTIVVDTIKSKASIASTKGFQNSIEPTKIEILPQSAKEISNATLFSNSEKTKLHTSLSSNNESISGFKSMFHQPEYDLLSRQPDAFVEETFHLKNIKTNLRTNNKKRSKTFYHELANNVDKRIDTVFHEKVTPVHKISFSDSFAFRKNSQAALQNVSFENVPVIHPTSMLRILRSSSARPKEHFNSKIAHRKLNLSSSILDATPAESSVSVQSKNTVFPNKSKRKHKSHRVFTTSVKNTQIVTENNNRRSYRPKSKAPATSSVASLTPNLHQINLNRTRWQYKTLPKPRVPIRKVVLDSVSNLNLLNTTILPVVSSSYNPSNISKNFGNQDPKDDADSAVILKSLDHENNNVDSTQMDLKNSYIETTAKKSTLKFQTDALKKTRPVLITTTSTTLFQTLANKTRAADESLSENILDFNNLGEDAATLDGSVTTLRPIYLTGTENTPSLETLTQSFSIVKKQLRTHLLPVIREHQNSTVTLTLIQTYDLTNYITATKTVASLTASPFIPSQNFKNYAENLDEAGSEINLDLQFDDEAYNIRDRDQVDIKPFVESLNPSKVFESMPIASQITDNKNDNLNSAQLQQLAFLNRFNPNINFNTAISPYQQPLEAESPNDQQNYQMLLKSIGAGSTDLLAGVVNKQQQQPQSPQLSVNPYLLPVQPVFRTIMSSIVYETVTTQTNKKVLKLTFGAKTAFTTIFSTDVVPTTLTMLVTTSLPVTPSNAFPGYFPPPYPPYAYLG